MLATLLGAYFVFESIEKPQVASVSDTFSTSFGKLSMIFHSFHWVHTKCADSISSSLTLVHHHRLVISCLTSFELLPVPKKYLKLQFSLAGKRFSPLLQFIWNWRSFISCFLAFCIHSLSRMASLTDIFSTFFGVFFLHPIAVKALRISGDFDLLPGFQSVGSSLVSIKFCWESIELLILFGSKSKGSAIWWFSALLWLWGL